MYKKLKTHVSNHYTGKGSLLMTSALLCAFIDLKTMVYSYVAKVNANLCILAEAWGGTVHYSLNKLMTGLFLIV